MKVIIDNKSGFCFGVKKAIRLAEDELEKGNETYCLGDIVHNEEEVLRLANLGLQVIGREEFFKLNNCKVLFRAHGEPPEVFKYAAENNIEILDGTCPVVQKLQSRIKKRYEELEGDGTVVIFGKPNHPEVIGLNGQIGNKGVVVQEPSDLDKVDFKKPVVLFSQTTMSKEKYWDLKTEAEKRLLRPDLLDACDTICGQVSNRAPFLKEFSKNVDALVFVGGKKSSNSKYLFSVCQEVNSNSNFVSSVEDLMQLELADYKVVGICGATSTPQWLMEKIAEALEEKYN